MTLGLGENSVCFSAFKQEKKIFLYPTILFFQGRLITLIPSHFETDSSFHHKSEII